jgi:hypothetical protein
MDRETILFILLGKAHPRFEIQSDQASFLRRLESPTGDIFRVNEHQGMGGAAFHAIGPIHSFTLIALEDLPKVPKWLRGAERADHDAHPATDAPFILDQDQAFFIPVEGSGRAGIQAGSVFAVPALDGEPFLRFNPIDSNPRQGRHRFIDRFGQSSGERGPVHRAGDFAAAAGRASLGIDKNGFHFSLEFKVTKVS